MTLMKLAIKINPQEAARFNSVGEVIQYIANLSLPFLLMANFSRILNNSEGYKKQLLRNGGAMAGIILLFMIFFFRYIVGVVGLLLQNPADAHDLVMTSFYNIFKKGFFAFNIFVDLFLCTLFMFFMNARPKKVFTGKWIYLFRAFAILPIAYEVGSIIQKGLSAAGKIQIPSWVFPFLTVKPPMTFVVFIILAIHIKTRELRYCRHGNTHEDYQVFLKTNRNAWHFSVYASIVLFIAGVIDMFIFTFLILGQAGSEEAANQMLESSAAINNSVSVAMGFGNSMILMFFAPIVLLFNYTKIPKNKTVGMLVPIVGILLIAIICVQGIYQLVSIAPIPKMDGQALTETINAIFMMLRGQ